VGALRRRHARAATVTGPSCRGWVAGAGGLGRVPRRAPRPSRARRAPQWRPAARPDCRGVAGSQKNHSDQAPCRVPTRASGSRHGAGAPWPASAGGGVVANTNAVAHGGWRASATDARHKLRKNKTMERNEGKRKNTKKRTKPSQALYTPAQSLAAPRRGASPAGRTVAATPPQPHGQQSAHDTPDNSRRSVPWPTRPLGRGRRLGRRRGRRLEQRREQGARHGGHGRQRGRQSRPPAAQ